MQNSSYIKLAQDLKQLVLLINPVTLHVKNNGTNEAAELAKDIYMKLDLLRSRLDDDYSNECPLEYNTEVFYGGIKNV